GHAFKARRNVHGLADGRVVVAPLGADIADDRATAIEADLDPITRAAERLAGRFCLHDVRDRGKSPTRRPLGMIGLRHWRPPYRHDRIADELIDIAARRLDRGND